MTITIKKIQLILIFVLAFFGLSLILSQNANPDATLIFGLKRIQEKTFLSFKSEPVSRLDYMSNMLENRLEELSNSVKNKKYDYVLPAASRYSSLAGQMTDLIIANNLSDKIDPVKNQFSAHAKVLHEIYVIYPKNTENVEYKYIEDDINYLKIYLDKLSKI